MLCIEKNTERGWLVGLIIFSIINRDLLNVDLLQVIGPILVRTAIHVSIYFCHVYVIR